MTLMYYEDKTYLQLLNDENNLYESLQQKL